MLPTMVAKSSRGPASSRQSATLPQYLRRILKWRQMDVEFCFWQMLHLCLSPKLVYQHTKYHKQTKNQWARDDPAFVVITCTLLGIASLSYAIAYAHSWFQAVSTVASAILFHFAFIGVAVASACWAITNQYLRTEQYPLSHAVEQRVEWLYAFDVHCNAFFPLFALLYVVQFFLSPLLLARTLLSTLLSNLLYTFAFCYYHYLNYLGYDVLPFLDRTTVLLAPCAVFILLFPFLVLSRFNPTQFVLGLYFS